MRVNQVSPSFKAKAKVGVSISKKSSPYTTKPRTNHSCWFITINTMVSLPEEHPYYEKFIDAFRHTLHVLFNNPLMLSEILSINKNVKNRDIDEVITEFQIEKGKKFNMIHAHGFVKMIHKTIAQIAYSKVRTWVKSGLLNVMIERGIPTDLLSSKNFYFYAKFLHEISKANTSKQQILDYIHKDSICSDWELEDEIHKEFGSTPVKQSETEEPKQITIMEKKSEKLVHQNRDGTTEEYNLFIDLE